MFLQRFKAFCTMIIINFILILPSSAFAEEPYDWRNTLLALNMAIVSVTNIIDTEDRIVLDQEYRNIIENLNLGNIKNDPELVTVQKTLMDVITKIKLSQEEAKRFAEKYARRQVTIFASALSKAMSNIQPSNDSRVMLVSLVTQCAGAFFGYPAAKEEIRSEFEDSLWKLEEEKVKIINGLQKDLLEAKWNLLQKYNIKQEYLISPGDLKNLNDTLQETNTKTAMQMFHELKPKFATYPPFWFYYGEAAYKSGDVETALTYFDVFDKTQRQVLNRDPYKVQIAKYRIMLEKNLSKEDILSLLNEIKVNSSVDDWLNNLFYGIVAFSIGEKDKGIQAILNNINFKTETEISPVVLEAMMSEEPDIRLLSKVIGAKLEPVVAVKTIGLSEQASEDYLAVGWNCLMGANGDKNDSEAFKSFAIAAKAGSAEAQYMMGYCYAKGWGVSSEPATAIQWFRRAARNRHGNAEEVIKQLKAIDEDVVTNCYLYHYLAKQGEKTAQCRLGKLLVDGNVNVDEGLQWLRKSADQQYDRAQLELGDYYYREEDFSNAYDWFMKAASQNNTPAQTRLGIMYARGYGVAQSKETAMKWFKSAANQGNKVAVKAFREMQEKGELSGVAELKQYFPSGYDILREAFLSIFDIGGRRSIRKITDPYYNYE